MLKCNGKIMGKDSVMNKKKKNTFYSDKINCSEVHGTVYPPVLY